LELKTTKTTSFKLKSITKLIILMHQLFTLRPKNAQMRWHWSLLI